MKSKNFCKKKNKKITQRVYQPQIFVYRLFSTIKKFAASFIKFGNINLINDVMKAIHSSGYKIDQGLFEMAISRYIDQPEKKDLLLQLLQWMPGQGYVVDSSTRNLLLRNSKLFGPQLIAEALSKQHISSKAPRSDEMKDK